MTGSNKGKGGTGGGRGTKLKTRGVTTRVKSARGRKLSSTRWLQRQLNDPYVAEAQRLNLRSRAAFKLIELDEKFGFLKPGARIIDLGCAPGGWTLVASERVKAGKPGGGVVVGMDLQEVDPVPNATTICHDFMDDDAPDILKKALNGPADVVLSDMAAKATGHTATDHMRIMDLCELALMFAREVLSPDGIFVAKVLQGGTEHQLLAEMRKLFKTVKHAKPPASRSDSAEMYVIAIGFRGEPSQEG